MPRYRGGAATFTLASLRHPEAELKVLPPHPVGPVSQHRRRQRSGHKFPTPCKKSNDRTSRRGRPTPAPGRKPIGHCNSSARTGSCCSTARSDPALTYALLGDATTLTEVMAPARRCDPRPARATWAPDYAAAGCTRRTPTVVVDANPVSAGHPALGALLRLRRPAVCRDFCENWPGETGSDGGVL